MKNEVAFCQGDSLVRQLLSFFRSQKSRLDTTSLITHKDTPECQPIHRSHHFQNPVSCPYMPKPHVHVSLSCPMEDDEIGIPRIEHVQARRIHISPYGCRATFYVLLYNQSICLSTRGCLDSLSSNHLCSSMSYTGPILVTSLCV